MIRMFKIFLVVSLFLFVILPFGGADSNEILESPRLLAIQDSENANWTTDGELKDTCYAMNGQPYFYRCPSRNPICCWDKRHQEWYCCPQTRPNCCPITSHGCCFTEILTPHLDTAPPE